VVTTSAKTFVSEGKRTLTKPEFLDPGWIRIMHDKVCAKQILEQTHLAIGKILKPWGLKGAVKIYSYAESPESFSRISEVCVQGRDGPIVLSLEEVKRHKKALLLKFKGRDRIEDVEELVGRTLYIDKKELPQLEEGEYYWHELVGMEVWTDAGKPLGTLEKILDTGSHDVYVVRKGDQETLIPAIRDVIQKVDVAGKRMVIHPIEGLLNEHDL
jgi:16S rRNA processing protein RimM